MQYFSKYGLIGKSLSHSFSQKFFTDKFKNEGLNCEYNLYELDSISEIEDLLRNTNLKGLNVTIPYKKMVLTYVDEISEEVQEIGASNTLKKLANGKWKAFNTDVYGFTESIKPLLQNNTKALILGTGGASKAVQYALQKLDISFTLVSRQPLDKSQLSYQEITAEIIQTNKLIINATPLGTFPNVDSLPPLPYASLSKQNILFDLVYNPTETTFLKMGKDAGCTLKNGLEMLHLQARKSWDIWSETI